MKPYDWASENICLALPKRSKMQIVVSLQAMDQRGRWKKRWPVWNLNEGEDQQVTGGVGNVELHEGLRGTCHGKMGKLTNDFYLRR